MSTAGQNQKDVLLQVRHLVGILNTVVVLQPVSTAELMEHSERAEELLNTLADSGTVRQLADKTWVATQRGLRLAGTREMGRKRDILRMYHLIERSKEGPEAEHGLGDVSSPFVQDA